MEKWTCELCDKFFKDKCKLVRHLHNIKICNQLKNDNDRKEYLEKIKNKRINAKMTMEQCEEEFKKLYNKNGEKIFTFTWLFDNGYRKLYDTYTHIKDCSLEKLVKKYEIYEEWKKNKKENHKKRPDLIIKNIKNKKWTDENIDQTMLFIIKKYGYLPPADHIDDEIGNLKKFHSALLRNGGIPFYKNKYCIIDRLRNYDILNRRWRSFPEAACSNFLISKDIIPSIGEKYNENYKKIYGKSAWYDLHFISPLTGKKINIEIWGGPGINNIGFDDYEKQKENKIKYHNNDDTFLHFNYRKAYKLENLEKIFFPYIGNRITLNLNNDIIDPTKWTLFNEILEKTKNICTHFDNGIFPPVNWFLKKCNFKNRKIDDWEDKSWCGFIDDIYKIGGVKVILKALKQDIYKSHSHRLTKEETIQGIKEVYDEYKKTIKAISHNKNIEEDLKLKLKKLIAGIKIHFNNDVREAYKNINVQIPIRQRRINQ